MTDPSSQPLRSFTIIFDLDGTLVHTAPDLVRALNHALIGAGLRGVPDMAVSDLVGSGARAMIEAGLAHQGADVTKQDIDAMFDVFLDYYVQNIAIESRPYKGCEDVLTQLAEAGATLCVCTNKKQVLAEELLRVLGLTDRFASIVGADSVPNRKPDPGHIIEAVSRAGGHLQNAIMIGDSVTDERAAHGAGLPFILCRFGYGPILAEPPAYRTTIDDFGGLTTTLVISTIEAYAATASRDFSSV
ncbi:MAG: HAD hydrolase-like protein [Pseudomonadota bacterium]